MNFHDEKVKGYSEKLKKFPYNFYRLESPEGNKLQDMLFSLMEIEDSHLSEEMRAKKNTLIDLIGHGKLGGRL